MQQDIESAMSMCKPPSSFQAEFAISCTFADVDVQLERGRALSWVNRLQGSTGRLRHSSPVDLLSTRILFPCCRKLRRLRWIGRDDLDSGTMI